MSAEPLRVAIIGAGIAGLAAAAVLRRSHEIDIYERDSASVQEVGAAIGLGPNGTKMAQTFGISRNTVKGVFSNGTRTYNQSGQLIKEFRTDFIHDFGSEWWFRHRIIFANENSVTADLVVGADGIRSKVRKAFGSDGATPLSPVNQSMYRFTLPRQKIAEVIGNIPDAFKYDDGAFLSIFVADDGSNHNIVVYPCRDLQVINIACAVPDSMLSSPPTETSWTTDGDVSEMKTQFHNFPSWIQGLMQNITEGQGTNQALEDAEGLKLLLEPGLEKGHLSTILKRWEAVRLPRASQIQINSRVASNNPSPEILAQRLKIAWTYDGINRALQALGKETGKYLVFENT